MANIRVVDFTGSNPENLEDVIEHLKFDDSNDYLELDDDVVKWYHSATAQKLDFVNINDLDNLIKALRYIKEKHK